MQSIKQSGNANFSRKSHSKVSKPLKDVTNIHKNDSKKKSASKVNNKPVRAESNNFNKILNNNSNTDQPKPIDLNINTKSLSQLNEIDKNNVSNIYECSEYAFEIYNYLQKYEAKHKNFLNAKYDFTEKMRSTIVDWIIEVHIKFKSLPETLYLCLNYFDRFINLEKISKSRLQLVIITCLFLASKYEEIYPPEMKDFIYVTDKNVSQLDMIKCEKLILKQLNFEICIPSIYRFLQRYSKLLSMDETTFYLSQYIAENQLIDTYKSKYTPSQIAAGSIYLASVNRNLKPWNDLLFEQTGYNEKCVLEWAKDFKKSVDYVIKEGYKGLKKKFQNSKYQEVSNLKIEI